MVWPPSDEGWPVGIREQFIRGVIWGKKQELQELELSTHIYYLNHCIIRNRQVSLRRFDAETESAIH